MMCQCFLKLMQVAIFLVASLFTMVFTMVGEILSLPTQPAAALVPEPLDSAPSVPPLPARSVRSLAARFEKNPNIRPRLWISRQMAIRLNKHFHQTVPSMMILLSTPQRHPSRGASSRPLAVNTSVGNRAREVLVLFFPRS
jgi:hypothetical protein